MRITGSIKGNVTSVHLTLNGKELPYVDSLSHLGHILSKDGKMVADTRSKRFGYIAKFNEVKESYKFLDPNELQEIILTHCTAFYGSNLWDLSDSETQKVYNLWNSSVRDIFNLPREARTYLIENVCSIHHGFKTDILSRFQKFAKSLFKCPIAPVRILATMLRSDVRSIFGKNIAYIEKITGINPLEMSRNDLINKVSVPREAPEGEQFMIEVVSDLYNVLQGEQVETERTLIHDMIHVL